MGFSDEDKILIKNMHDSKGYRGRAQKNDESFLKRLEQNWTIMQRRIYQKQILHSVDDLRS